MKKSLVITILFVVMLAVSSPGFCGDAKQEMSPEQMAWVEYMTPGWAHEFMAKSAGKWVSETKFWHSPDMKPEVNKGTIESKMILGGRYLESKYTGTAMGQAMNGVGWEGYDNAKKEFVSIWVDSRGTGMAISTGKISEDKKTIEYKGTMTDPMTKSELKTRSVAKFLGDDKNIFEMFVAQGGKEFKMMEIVSTRVK